MRAWRSKTGAVQLSKNTVPDAEPLVLPCGGCLGCRTEKAREWALRCQMELKQHDRAAFTTLTYDEAHCPPTLAKRDLQLFLKKVRKAAEPLRLRFFASGEYGEKNARPHYHAILFGLSEHDEKLVDRAWQLGFTRTERLTPARIAYCAGYVSKKIGFKRDRTERVDPDTGEVYTWEPPFLQMSRGGRHGHGIGGDARKYTSSWRMHAVFDGMPMKTPRYYEAAWRATATAQMLEARELERQQYRVAKSPITLAQREASERIAISKQAESSRTRKL